MLRIADKESLAKPTDKMNFVVNPFYCLSVEHRFDDYKLMSYVLKQAENVVVKSK